MDYCDFMADYAEFFENVREQEKEKLEALLSNDLPRMQKSLSEQQIVLKKAEAMEKKRLAMLKEIGCENLPLREVAARFDGEEKQRIISSGIRLDRAVKSIQYFNRKALEIAGMQMEFFYDQDTGEENSHFYTAQGKTDSSKKSGSFSKEV